MEHPLISSYGLLPGTADAKAAVLSLTKPYNIFCSSLKLQLDPEECNYHTSNTKDVAGQDFEIDLPLHEYSPLPATGFKRLLKFNIVIVNNEKCITGNLRQYSFEEASNIGYKALSYAWGDPFVPIIFCA